MRKLHVGGIKMIHSNGDIIVVENTVFAPKRDGWLVSALPRVTPTPILQLGVLMQIQRSYEKHMRAIARLNLSKDDTATLRRTGSVTVTRESKDDKKTRVTVTLKDGRIVDS